MSKAATRPAIAVFAALMLLGWIHAPAMAAPTKLTIRAMSNEVLVGKTFVLFGSTSPAAKGVVVTRQVFRDKTWKATGTAITNGKGEWRMVVTAPAWRETLRLRVQAKIKGKLLTSPTVKVAAVTKLTPRPISTPKPTATPTPTQTPAPTPTEPTPTPTEPTPAPTPTETPDYTADLDGTPTQPTIVITKNGKGNRILGSDISRWQHPKSTLFPDGAPINFQKMYNAGVRFLYIKASDGRDLGHDNAERWYASDRADAQAAGIYTGFYHFAYFPASTVPSEIIADAQAQADKALWRLSAVGGYNQLDLPYALDIEVACVAYNASGKCTRNVTKTHATLWVKTWLARMESRTQRKPVVYASPSFIQGYLNRDPVLRQYPLWVAHYDRDPAVPTNFPGMKSDGTCFIHAWTLNNCQSQWAIWQYTSSGKATNFGVAGGNLDLNLYSGSSEEFLEFASGVWVPSEGDFLPFNETTTTLLSNVTFSATTSPLTASINVLRPTGLPVVSGAITFALSAGPDGIAPTPEQLAKIKLSTTRTAVGSWTARVTGLPAGTWNGIFTFTDTSRVHATSNATVPMTIIGPPTPEPTPTPPPTESPSSTPSPEPTPSPTP